MLPTNRRQTLWNIIHARARFFAMNSLFIDRLWTSTNFWCIWAIRSMTNPKPQFNIYYCQNFIHVLQCLEKQNKTTKKKTTAIRLHQFVFLGWNCFVCSYYGRSNQVIKIQRFMRLPGSNFRGLFYSQTFHVRRFRYIRQPTLRVASKSIYIQ